MGHFMLDQIILNNLPRNGLSVAFGYGSKVVKQGGSSYQTSDLIDVILAVDNSEQWHRENLSRNSQHYSAVRYLNNNAKRITSIQEHYGANVYFNPYIQISNLSLKYGIIKTEHLIEDLNTWSNLYVAGRLHKPVEFIFGALDRNEKLRTALRFNKESAIRASLLQLPESFEPLQLYRVITGLSYHGDLRMLFGEDKNKIDNIVTKQMDKFEQLYLPVLRMSPNFKNNVHWLDGKRLFVQDTSPVCIYKNLCLLPKNLSCKICEVYGRDARSVERETILTSLSKNTECDSIVASALKEIVRKSSLSQSIKGLITAGLFKSIRYSNRKLYKSILSRVT